MTSNSTVKTQKKLRDIVLYHDITIIKSCVFNLQGQHGASRRNVSKCHRRVHTTVTVASIIEHLVSRGFLSSETTKTTKNQQKLWKHGNLVLGYEDEVGLEWRRRESSIYVCIRLAMLDRYDSHVIWRTGCHVMDSQSATNHFLANLSRYDSQSPLSSIYTSGMWEIRLPLFHTFHTGKSTL